MPKRLQVTCYCKAYSFPHRVGGGLCTGGAWAKYYYENHGSLCMQCSANTPQGCDLVAESEDIRHCEAYQDHLHSQPEERFPSDIEEEYVQLLETYYQEE